MKCPPHFRGSLIKVVGFCRQFWTGLGSCAAWTQQIGPYRRRIRVRTSGILAPLPKALPKLANLLSVIVFPRRNLIEKVGDRFQVAHELTCAGGRVLEPIPNSRLVRLPVRLHIVAEIFKQRPEGFIEIRQKCIRERADLFGKLLVFLRQVLSRLGRGLRRRKVFQVVDVALNRRPLVNHDPELRVGKEPGSLAELECLRRIGLGDLF